MEEFSEAEFNKILNDCEIHILPDNSTIEEFLNKDFHKIGIQLPSSGVNNETNSTHEEFFEDNEEEDFKRSYELSKAKSRSDDAIVCLTHNFHR